MNELARRRAHRGRLLTGVLAAPWLVHAGRAASPPTVDVPGDAPELTEAMLALGPLTRSRRAAPSANCAASAGLR